MDFKKYFDRIICLDCLDEKRHAERIESSENEIRRLGISGLTEFAHMQRLPYIRNIVKGYAKDMRIMKFDYSDESCFRSFDYSINLVRILKSLIADHAGKTLFFEDDIAFLKDTSLIDRILSLEPPDLMISLYDGYVPETQKEFFRLSRINDLWFDYLLMWNTDCFSLSADGMKYIVSAMEKKLAYTDYYTWATPGTFLKVMRNDLYIPEWKTTVSHAISKIPLGVQKECFSKNSMHGKKNNVKNLIKYDLNMFNI